MKKTRIVWFAAAVFFLYTGTLAAASKNDLVQSSDSPRDKVNIQARQTFSTEEAAKLLKGLGKVKEIKLSPVKGLYEVTMERNNRSAVIYVDFEKKHLIPGPIYDIKTKRSITPPPSDLPKIISKDRLEKIPLSNSIVLGNPSGKKRLFVFTDPDCSFCARLHGELKKLVEKEPDLAIYIKMYPLKMHPKANDHARVILGAGVKGVEMLEKAFSGQPLPAPGKGDSEKPVSDTLLLAESLGIHSTPTLIFPDGTVEAGARDAATLRIMLEKNQ